MLRAMAAVNVVEVGPEIIQIRRPEKSSESGANDFLRLREVLVGEWPHPWHCVSPVVDVRV